jgi:histidine kinase
MNERTKLHREYRGEDSPSKEELIAAYRYLANILESMLDAVVVANPDGTIRTVNRAALELLGYTEEEITGQPVGVIFEEEEEEEFFRGTGFVQLVRKGAARNVELMLRTKSGERIPVLFNGSVIREENGRLAAVLGVARDIRARKQAEEELRKAKEELELRVEQRTKELSKERDYTRHLIESSPDFQMTLGTTGNIMDVNEAFEKIVGKSREEVIGRSIYAYLPREEIEKVMAEVLERGKVRNVELTDDVPGRGTLVCNLSGTVFTTPEGEVGIYLSGWDVTDQKRREQELREREMQIAHASRLSSLGEMAAGMAHEINQPLSIISTAAEGILRDMRKDRFDMSLLPQDMQDVLDNVERIDRLITHMRTFARRPEECEYVEPEQVLDNAFAIVGGQFQLRNVLVSRKIKKDLPAIYVNPNQLEQVLINVLTNARQALDKRAEEAESRGERFQKRLVCRISRENEWVVFELADNGVSVPDEIKMRIFDPFFTTKEVGQGTGLGLSIAYTLVTRWVAGSGLRITRWGARVSRSRCR